jgi:predicted component of type VI protein secretion system
MQTGRLPKRVPVGTKYIIEGKKLAEGQVHVFSRYLLFPDGRCFDLPSDSEAAPHPDPAARPSKPSYGHSSAKKH